MQPSSSKAVGSADAEVAPGSDESDWEAIVDQHMKSYPAATVSSLLALEKEEDVLDKSSPSLVLDLTNSEGSER